MRGYEIRYVGSLFCQCLIHSLFWGCWGAWMTFKKAEMPKNPRSGLADHLKHKLKTLQACQAAAYMTFFYWSVLTEKLTQENLQNR